MNQLSCKVVAVVALALSPGCALFASASLAHSHIGPPCVDEVGYSVVDILLAVVSTAVVAGTGSLDDSPAWMAVPGVFVTSGVVGAIYVHKCRGDFRDKKTGPMPVYQETPLEPVRASDLPDATREELGLDEAPPPTPTTTTPPPPTPIIDATPLTPKSTSPGPRLQLPADSALKEAPPPPVVGSGPPIMCGIDLPNTCPRGTECKIVAAGRGSCEISPAPLPPPAAD